MAAAALVRRGTSARVAILEEAKELGAGIAGQLFIQMIPAGWVATAAEMLPDSLLTDNDSRLRWSAGAGLVAGTLLGLESAQRNALQSFLVQTAEEIGKRSAEMDGRGTDKDRKVIHEAAQKHKGLLEPLRSQKDQGDKMQQKALPDYFTAKATMEDDKLREKLSKIEQAFEKADKDAFVRFMRKGAYRVQTTPKELVDIAKTSEGPDHTYGIMRLQSLMAGQRGEGSTGSKLKSIAEGLLDDVLDGNDADTAARKFGTGVKSLTASIPRKQFK